MPAAPGVLPVPPSPTRKFSARQKTPPLQEQKISKELTVMLEKGKATQQLSHRRQQDAEADHALGRAWPNQRPARVHLVAGRFRGRRRSEEHRIADGQRVLGHPIRGAVSTMPNWAAAGVPGAPNVRPVAVEERCGARGRQPCRWAAEGVGCVRPAAVDE
ncbi:hypothetical protein NDU88_007679 [Pleurodeles waltl]|uniref:Uncharacterized protein n=1 Tax=Pleurodeles waltl TaxID=8319 RepID=A0AAV7SSZ6_PLEWA|nr:hypothetical protein NDU88_007679 [Pleurodeles waltl]